MPSIKCRVQDRTDACVAAGVVDRHQTLGMKSLITLVAFVALISTAFGTDPKETMCVKLKDGTYLCKASGKIEKKPCCDTPSNEPKRKPKKTQRSN